MVNSFSFNTLTVDKITEYINQIKTDYTNILDQIVNIGEGVERTFENTVRPKIRIGTIIEPINNLFGYVTNFWTEKEMRDAGTNAESEIARYFIEADSRKDVYHAFKQYYTTNYINEKPYLSHEENRYVDEIMRNFRRDGLDLDDDTELKVMKKRLSDLSNEFSKNINDDDTSFIFTRQQLDGLPESWFNTERLVTKNDDESQSVYKVTMKYPDIVPCQEYVKDGNIRKQLYAAYNSRAPGNVKIFEEIVPLRYKIGKLLGYNNYADYVTEVKIVKNSDYALNFLNTMNKRFDPLYEKDMEKLTNFAKNYTANPLNKDKLDPYDIVYYKRLCEEAEFDVDMEEIKNFFPLDVVKNGMFQIYQTIFGLTFEEIPTENKWHEEVKLYSTKDNSSGKIIGYFYLDMHPRTGKYSHAAVFDFQSGCDMSKIDGTDTRRLNICAMICNFPKGEPISFSDVVTFFHEMGHIYYYHCLCSNTQLYCYNRFGVERDFVECPSQMLENFCYQLQPLQIMSSHKETGQSVPEDLIKKLKALENSFAGYHYKRQLNYGMVDLTYHRMTFDNEDDKLDSQQVWYDVQKLVMQYDVTDKYNPVASFGHIIGYCSGYYGYLLSETYSANILYKMFKGDCLNPTIGMAYRNAILARGSTVDGLDLLHDYLGEIDESYFLESKGLVVVVKECNT